MVRQADTEMTVVKDEVLYSQLPRNRRCGTQFRGPHGEAPGSIWDPRT